MSDGALRAVLGSGPVTPAGQLFLDTDWTATAIGAPQDWSPTLRAAISTAMTTRFGMLVMAGPELVMVYNDAYAPVMGALHPAMGRPLPEVWADVWSTLEPMVDAVLVDQVANHFEDFLLWTSRNGFLEETYFTYSYSPLIDPDDGVVGLLNTVVETTDRVLATRRLQLAQQLGATGATRHADLGAAAAAVADVLGRNRDDLPVAGVFLLQDPADLAGPLVFRAGYGLDPRDDDAGAREWLRAALTGGRQTAHDLGAELGGRATTAVALPLTPPGRAAPVGVLVLGLSRHLRQDDDYRTFQDLVAHQVAGVLGDTLTHLTEQAAAAASRSMSETLQRSLLSEPVHPEHLQVATRYRPAVAQAEIGGDWYDAFTCPDGSTWLVVGDVAGHDQTAAAAMAQVRNLLRGIAHTLQRSPSAVLTALDAAMGGLGVGVLTSVVVVRVAGRDGPAGSTTRLTWSNAGHPPPLVARADGAVVPLLAPVDLILGALPDGPRHDHELELAPGDGLVLYTDGLVERRSRDLDHGQAWLVEQVAARRGRPVEEICDELLAAVVDHAEDDIALLVLRAR